jgi:PilZ domain-containing protein
MLSITQSEEKRRTQRHHLGRVAAIVFGADAEQHYCLVTDISEGGVRLHIKELNVPDDFSLRFAPDVPAQSGNYKVVWRRGQDLGAKFVGAGAIADQ